MKMVYCVTASIGCAILGVSIFNAQGASGTVRSIMFGVGHTLVVLSLGETIAHRDRQP